VSEPHVEGLKTFQSAFGPEATMDRLLAEIASKGLTVFARIDHSALASGVGLSLSRTELVLFGNPRGGTPLMQENQTIGIDLPLKALIWQDPQGRTWLSYNDPEWLALRHKISRAGVVIDTLRKLIEVISAAATGRPPAK